MSARMGRAGFPLGGRGGKGRLQRPTGGGAGASVPRLFPSHSGPKTTERTCLHGWAAGRVRLSLLASQASVCWAAGRWAAHGGLNGWVARWVRLSLDSTQAAGASFPLRESSERLNARAGAAVWAGAHGGTGQLEGRGEGRRRSPRPRWTSRGLLQLGQESAVI